MCLNYPIDTILHPCCAHTTNPSTFSCKSMWLLPQCWHPLGGICNRSLRLYNTSNASVDVPRSSLVLILFRSRSTYFINVFMNQHLYTSHTQLNDRLCAFFQVIFVLDQLGIEPLLHQDFKFKSTLSTIELTEHWHRPTNLCYSLTMSHNCVKALVLSCFP